MSGVSNMPAATTYGLKWNVRGLESLHTEHSASSSDVPKFLVGTCSLERENELHLLEYSSDSREISCTKAMRHRAEIAFLSVMPPTSGQGGSPVTFVTGGAPKNAQNDIQVPCVWRFSLEAVPDEPELLTSVEGKGNPIRGVRKAVWCEAGSGHLVMLDKTGIRLFDGKAPSPFSNSVTIPIESARKFTAAVDPHHPQQVAVSYDDALAGWDIRSGARTFTKENAHTYSVHALEYNPNVPHCLCTGGEDGVIKIWDIRAFSSPLTSLERGHSHWVTCVAYNFFHDELLLSAGSDYGLCLWRCREVSSKRDLATSGGATPTAEEVEDGIIRKCEDNEDSVYGVAWSAADPWVFASVSFSGLMMIGHVPPEEKYRILL